ncbi:MAG: hypothetical protein JNL11_09350 [Bdellovibrionaceae bacterium]|nr:hypothetical protein [Pseudobdellovibrionaceae bacterium]
MQRKVVRVLILFTVLCCVSCSNDGFNSMQALDVDASKLAPGDGDSSEFHPPPEDEDVPQPVPVVISPTPNFCSELDLLDVTWPVELADSGQAHLGLALNITGSFEGRSGWANLSNNFDGMGFSIGLLQQNLGMGSLQPIINDMVAMSNDGRTFDMTDSYFQSLKSMVSQWNKKLSSKTVFTSSSSSQELFFSDEKNISAYDVDAPDLGDSGAADKAADNADGMVSAKSVASANATSISWAFKTVYSDNGKTFKQPWADNLNKMAKSKPYISLQLKYAMKLYTQAFRYFNAFNLSTQSHFLLMFDFVVQNGGFKQKVINEYALKVKAKPHMTEQEKALLILELRLKDVIPRWQNDVSSRKKTIIFSEGTVHGVKRNLKTEYCYDPSLRVLTRP